MNKRTYKGCLCLLLAVVLVLGLAGCGKYPTGFSVTHKDLTLILPGDFIQLPDDGNADFLYGWHTLVVKGLSEQKDHLVKMTLKEYTDYVISTNKKTATPTACGDGFLFTYEATVGEQVYAYTVATYEGPENFWILQFYCPKENLVENQPEIDIILEGIQPK